MLGLEKQNIMDRTTPYRSIYNQDSTNLFYTTPYPITPGDVDNMVKEVAAAGVDLLLLNPNAQRSTVSSRVWPTLWDGFEEDPGFWGEVPFDQRVSRGHMVRQMKRLHEEGCNYLSRALDACRNQGMAGGVTFRVNDMHDAPLRSSHLFCPLYTERPELRLPHADRGWSGVAFDFAHEEVREYTLAYLEELITGYSFDVLELDFLRFAYFLRRDQTESHSSCLTSLVERVHFCLKHHQPQAHLLVRLPATPGNCRELGLRPDIWTQEGWISGITLGNFLTTPWQLPFTEFRRWVGESVPLYACSEYAAARWEERNHAFLSSSPELIRGFAAAHWAAGADGLYWFNFFCAREGPAPLAPSFGTLMEARDPDRLRGREKTYLATGGISTVETDAPQLLPLHLPPEWSSSVPLHLASEPSGSVLVFDIEIDFETKGRFPSNLFAQWDGRPLGRICSMRPQNALPGWLGLPVAWLHDGVHHLVLRNESGNELCLRQIQVRIRPPS